MSEHVLNVADHVAEKKIKVIQLIHGLSMGGEETLVKDYCCLLEKM